MAIQLTAEDHAHFAELFHLCPDSGERMIFVHADGEKGGYGVRRPDGTAVFLHVRAKGLQAFTLHWIDGPLAQG